MQARPAIRDSRRWLYTVARNHCLDLLRKRSRRTRVIAQLVPLTGGTLDPGQQVVTRDVARQTLRRLKPRERAILWRSLVEGASLQELAVEFRLTYPAAAKLLHRSRGRSQALIRAISALIVPDLFRILEALVRLVGRAERRAADVGAADAFDKGGGLVVPAAVIGTLAAGSVAISAPTLEARSPEPITAAISTEVEPTGGELARPVLPSLRLQDSAGITKVLLPPKLPVSNRPLPAPRPRVTDPAAATGSGPLTSVPPAAATGAGVAVKPLPTAAPAADAPSTASVVDGTRESPRPNANASPSPNANASPGPNANASPSPNASASPSPNASASPPPSVDPMTRASPVPSPSASPPDPGSRAPVSNSAVGPDPKLASLPPSAAATTPTNTSPPATCPVVRHRGPPAPSPAARSENPPTPSASIAPVCANGAYISG